MNQPTLPELDLDRLRTCSAVTRPAKVHRGLLGRPRTDLGPTLRQFLASFPDMLAARDLRSWAAAVRTARRSGCQVAAALGGHVVKAGCGPYVSDLVRRGVITAVAMNGAAAIHDAELAIWGKTSESVEERLPSGDFGMAQDTALLFAEASGVACSTDCGLGAALGRVVFSAADAADRRSSILTAAHETDVPCTVHVSVGCDVTHIHGVTRGDELGAATLADFRTLCRVVASLQNGVWMNLGSAVVLPEVFLKAFSVARNLGYDLSGLTAVDLDMIKGYRPSQNVLARTGARALQVTGHHELVLPFFHALVADLEAPDA